MSLQVWLPLNGNSLANQGISNISITNSDASYVVGGKLGKCYQFNGTTSYVSISGDTLCSVIKGSDIPLSISAWVYKLDSNEAVLVGDSGLSGSVSFNIGIQADHKVNLQWSDSAQVVFNNSIISTSVWTHVIITYSGAELNCYINGSLTDTITLTLKKVTKTSGILYIGKDNKFGTIPFNGKLNDIRIYDHCVSPREAKEIFKSLLVHFPLNQLDVPVDSPRDTISPNNKEYDCSGYKNNGTLYGIVTIREGSERNNICYEFDSTGHIISGHSDDILPSDNITVSCWAYLENWSPETKMKMISCYDNGGWHISVNDTVGYVSVVVKTSASTNLTCLYKLANIIPGWHHYAFMFDGSILKFYVDGSLVNSTNTNSTTIRYNTATHPPVVISGETSNAVYSGSSFVGKLSDVRIYATALNEEDIKELYNMPIAICNNGTIMTQGEVIEE